MIRAATVLLAIALTASAFQGVPSWVLSTAPSTSLLVISMNQGKNGEEEPSTAGGWNPLKGVTDLFSNIDDVIDDFMGKRMGNGEVFYGKRKSNPSGRTEGEYNGMGLTDKRRIDVARDYKESYLEGLRRRQDENL